MRAIRNFFHDINDILLAIIIVVIAAGIIYWRMGIILDYPKQLAADQASYEQSLEDDEEESEEAAAGEDAENQDAAGESADAAGEDSQPEPQG